MIVNHTLSIKKLRKFAKKIGVSIRFTSASQNKLPDYVAYFDPYTKRIMIQNKLKKNMPKLIYVMAHEIGHAIDFSNMNKKDRYFNDKACQLFHIAKYYGYKIPKELSNVIIEREHEANKNGEKLITELAIPLQNRTIRRYRNAVIDGYKHLFRSN